MRRILLSTFYFLLSRSKGQPRHQTRNQNKFGSGLVPHRAMLWCGAEHCSPRCSYGGAGNAKTFSQEYRRSKLSDIYLGEPGVSTGVVENEVLGSVRGQSLVEVLLAVAIGASFVIAVATIIAPALRINTQAGRVQTGSALAKELLDSTRVWADGSWRNIADLATTSANHYYLNTSASPFTSVSGDELVTIATTTYTRYFYVDDVSRISDEIVTSGGFNDPSTKKITVEYSWPNSATNSIQIYLTRRRNNIFSQTDWSGGPGQEGPATSTNTQFATSSKIDYSTTTGSIIIDL